MTTTSTPGESQYGVILADPPWAFRNSGRGAAINHYPTLLTEDIAALPVITLAKSDCVLYLWSTWTHLKDSLFVMASWGFHYKTGLPWVKGRAAEGGEFKPQMGTGFWLRGCSEVLLTGVRGGPKVPAPYDRMLGILAPRARHSKKPESAYTLAERHPGPWLELFARENRPGWDAWGNQVDRSVVLNRFPGKTDYHA